MDKKVFYMFKARWRQTKMKIYVKKMLANQSKKSSQKILTQVYLSLSKLNESEVSEAIIFTAAKILEKKNKKINRERHENAKLRLKKR